MPALVGVDDARDLVVRPLYLRPRARLRVHPEDLVVVVLIACERVVDGGGYRVSFSCIWFLVGTGDQGSRGWVLT
jgi:hypothetical protein